MHLPKQLQIQEPFYTHVYDMEESIGGNWRARLGLFAVWLVFLGSPIVRLDEGGRRKKEDFEMSWRSWLVGAGSSCRFLYIAEKENDEAISVSRTVLKKSFFIICTFYFFIRNNTALFTIIDVFLCVL